VALTDAEKAAAFDLLADAPANRLFDGRWQWWCHTPCGGPQRATKGEAVADLIAYAEREAGHLKRRAKYVGD
jgi:hypothetical protein